MNDYVNCHRCGVIIASDIATKQGTDWYCSDKCYDIHKAYQDGYFDGRNETEDQGTSIVNKSGMASIKRKHAGKKIKWIILKL